MFGARSLAAASLVVSMMSSAAHAGAVGMLSVGNKTTTGLAVEIDTNGDVFMLLEINGNGKRVEFGFATGSPFDDGAVVNGPSGEPMAVLSIYSGEEQGMVNSQDVSIIDPAKQRSRQRTNLSQDLRNYAQAGRLRDQRGRTYSFAEIKGVSLVFQVFDTNYREYIQSQSNFQLAELQVGTVKQLAGEEVTAP